MKLTLFFLAFVSMISFKNYSVDKKYAKTVSNNCCRVKLNPGSTIADTTVVYFSGEIKDENKKHISDAYIYFCSENNQFRYITDSCGTFDFKFMPSGTYKIWVDAEGYCKSDTITEIFGSGAGKTAEICLTKNK